MDIPDSVFHSDITVEQKHEHSELIDLITSKNIVQPVNKIITTDSSTENVCEFKANADKHYKPKINIVKLNKVKTVQEIRRNFEQDVNKYLTEELEKKEKYLLDKISSGYSHKLLKNTAVKLLRSDDSLNRATFQILANLNPFNKTHPVQYVLCNGNHIRISGSYGGNRKFILNYDIAKKKINFINKPIKKQSSNIKSLLKNSLETKFRPGPLKRKLDLDCSYQQYNVGKPSLVTLPKVALSIQPQIGVHLEPDIVNVLNHLRKNDDILSKKWAEYAASVVGVKKNGELVQTDSKSVVFDLNYTNKQNIVLMRQHELDSTNITTNYTKKETHVSNVSEIQTILDEMLNAVEISLSQDEMFDSEEFGMVDNNNETAQIVIKPTYNSKHKLNRQKELRKLDVTVISMPDSTSDLKKCQRDCCILGCICSSLQCNMMLKNHCGLLNCMFDCKCDYSNFKLAFDKDEHKSDDMLPAIVNMDKKMNSQLAKEEKKFHQTVILSDDKSIVLQSRRRSIKTPKICSTKIPNLCSKVTKKLCRIVLTNLPCHNIKPWCMVHNLYNCFCKCVFTKNLKFADIPEEVSIKTLHPQISYKEPDKLTRISVSSDDSITYVKTDHICSRMKTYVRNFDDLHYRKINEKIKKLEVQDNSLDRKLLNHVNASIQKYNLDTKNNLPKTEDENITDIKLANKRETNIEVNVSSIKTDLTKNENKEINTETLSKVATQTNFINLIKDSDGESSMDTESSTRDSLPKKNNLISWLEKNYKHYKENCPKNMRLVAPEHKKLALYPREIIVDRFINKKNYFLVTKQSPYRIFMAVKKRDVPFDCILLNDITGDDISKYPATVKNILNNHQNMPDNFYILCGLHKCWELIGSVTKISEQNESHSNGSIDRFESHFDTSLEANDSETVSQNIPTSNVKICDKNNSKWILLILGEDFSEIQFRNKGFFVKSENITKAMKVARLYGKTVRLSSNKCNGNTTGPQFGIYVTSESQNVTVFVGPYMMKEPLSITIINKPQVTNSITKGYFIITKTEENLNVIEDPTQYINKDIKKNLIFKKYKDNGDIITTILEDEEKISDEKNDDSTKESSFGQPEKLLPSASTETPISDDSKNESNDTKGRWYSSIFNNQTPVIQETYSLANVATVKKKPVAEIAPQLQTYSGPRIKKILPFNNRSLLLNQAKCESMTILKPEEVNLLLNQAKIETNVAMSILKPEEINRRIENNFNVMSVNPSSELDDKDADIENFLATSEECGAPDHDLPPLMLSDEEIHNAQPIIVHRSVYLVCKNIPNLGYIRGKRNADGEISFEFPGFKFTQFYKEDDAFVKVQQVLSRKVYVPKSIRMVWSVEETEPSCPIMNSEYLNPEMILTPKGLMHKFGLMKKKVELLNFQNIASNSSESSNEIDVIPDTEIKIEEHTVEEMET